MNESVYYAAFFFPSAAAVIIFALKYLAQMAQARVRATQDQSYKIMAEQAIAAHSETMIMLNDLQARLSVVEKILKDVE